MSRMARTARTFSWSVVRIDGVLRRMLIPSDAATVIIGGIAAEKTNDVPLIRFGDSAREPGCIKVCTYLMLDYDIRAGAEPTCCVKTVGD